MLKGVALCYYVLLLECQKSYGMSDMCYQIASCGLVGAILLSCAGCGSAIVYCHYRRLQDHMSG